MLAADSNAAMIYINGAASVNNARVPRSSSAIFSGDLLQTGVPFRSQNQRAWVKHHGAVRFPGAVPRDLGRHSARWRDCLDFKRSCGHGWGCESVARVEYSWTEFNVVDTDGTVRIAARKGDLTIDDGSRRGARWRKVRRRRRDENNPDCAEATRRRKTVRLRERRRRPEAEC